MVNTLEKKIEKNPDLNKPRTLPIMMFLLYTMASPLADILGGH